MASQSNPGELLLMGLADTALNLNLNTSIFIACYFLGVLRNTLDFSENLF